MARTGMKNTMMLFIKPSLTKKGLKIGNKRGMSKLVDDQVNPRAEDESRRTLDDPPAGSWGPHPRSGIYFPKGQERVMEDIPDGAASLDQAFWLRNTDNGVDVDKQDYIADVTHHNKPN